MKKYVHAGLILAATLMLSAMTAYAGTGKKAVMVVQNGVVSGSADQTSSNGPLTPPAEQKEVNMIPDQVNVPDQASVLLVVDAEKDADHGTLRAYKRAADRSWQLQLTANAMIGMKGLYKTAEGDCRTPVGVFRMNTPFGILDRQEGFPSNYLKVDGNYYWSGDSNSTTYNKLVDIRKTANFNTKGSEHLVDYKGYYDYGIEIGYNPEGTPHRGSAIFLHCSVNNQATHGCIGIPAADMISVLRMYEEGTTYFAVYDRADPAAICRK